METTEKKREQFSIPDGLNDSESLLFIVLVATGQVWKWAKEDVKPLYAPSQSQLIPGSPAGQEFFKWHEDHRAQFYENQFEAVANLILSWHEYCAVKTNAKT